VKLKTKKEKKEKKRGGFSPECKELDDRNAAIT